MVFFSLQFIVVSMWWGSLCEYNHVICCIFLPNCTVEKYVFVVMVQM